MDRFTFITLRIALIALLGLLLVACPATGSAPTSPTNVVATPGPGYVTVSWRDGSDDETGFVIYRATATGAVRPQQRGTRIGEVGADATRFIDRDIDIGTSYVYSVAAANGAGESVRASAGTVVVDPGVDLMVGTNARRYDDGTGTIFVVYYALPNEVLDDDGLVFEVTIVGPNGWNGGDPLEDTSSAGGFSRDNGFGFLSLSSVDAVAGSYTLTVAIDGERYTASATLDATDFRLAPPTDIDVTEASATRVDATWTAPPETGSVWVSLWRGDYDELVADYARTSATSYTFEDLELEDGVYQIEVAPLNVDITTLPIKVNPFGLSYETRSFVIGSAASPLCSGPDEIVDIPDIDLERAIRDAIRAPSDDLSCGVLATLDELEAPERGITSLEGLQYAVNLERLDLRDNASLDDVSPLESLPRLRRLLINRTAVRDVSPLASLTTLIDLGVESLELDADDLGLLSDLTGLEYLGLEGNPIADATPIAAFTNLDELEIQQTGITDLAPLAPLIRLVELNIGELGVSDISVVGGFPALERLYAQENEIVSIAPLLGYDLAQLNLDWNPIEGPAEVAELIDWLDGLSEPESLRLNGIPLGTLSFVEGATGLEILSVYATGLGDAELAPLAALIDLREVFLGGDDLNDVSAVASLAGLETFSLEETDVTDLTPLQGLTALRELELAGNAIADLAPLVANPGLGDGDEIDLRGNALDLNDGSDDRAAIATLEARGADVAY